jgi:hypothetical protein
MRRPVWIVIGVIVCRAVVAGAAQVHDGASYQQPGFDLAVYAGSVELPANGDWELVSQRIDDPTNGFYLILDVPVDDTGGSRRMAMAELRRVVERGKSPIEQVVRQVVAFALKHDGQGPSSIDDLDESALRMARSADSTSPWRDEPEIEGPFVFLMPDLSFQFASSGGHVFSGDRKRLAFELRPYVDDGKHWVCYTDQSCERLPVDLKLMDRYKVTIRPVHGRDGPESSRRRTTESYEVVGLRPPGDTSVLRLVARSSGAYDHVHLEWDLSQASPGTSELMGKLRWARSATWIPYGEASGSTVLATWRSPNLFESGRTGARQMSVFGVLGGRAAIRETLPMQPLLSGQQRGALTIDVASIGGRATVPAGLDAPRVLARRRPAGMVGELRRAHGFRTAECEPGRTGLGSRIQGVREVCHRLLPTLAPVRRPHRDPDRRCTGRLT